MSTVVVIDRAYLWAFHRQADHRRRADLEAPVHRATSIEAVEDATRTAVFADEASDLTYVRLYGGDDFFLCDNEECNAL